VEEAFSDFGKIGNVEYIPEKAIAFIRYKTKGSARRAIREMEGFKFNGSEIALEICYEDRYCKNCKKSGHFTKECRYRDIYCYHCRLPGHKAKDCKAENKYRVKILKV
jgi:RNA recognition motif-containing protein